MPDSFSSTLPFVSGHRAADRFDAQLSMQVAGVSARTRNISATGVFFEAEVDLPVGSLANVNVPYVRGGRQHWLTCEAKVVRVTFEEGQHGFGARLLTPFFSSDSEHYVAVAAKRRDFLPPRSFGG
jgi:hypothetical protein